MESLNKFIITLVTTIVLISSIELISPNNSMKKYIKFVLGLILIAVMIDPIISFFTNGKDEIVTTINNYESLLKSNELPSNNSEFNVNDQLKEVFNEDLNTKCNSQLKEKFSEYDFYSDIQCDVNVADMTYEIKKVKVGIATNKIQSVKKVDIGNDETATNYKIEYTEDEVKILNYLESLFDITSDKIEIYMIDG